jgi:hypothetical protein
MNIKFLSILSLVIIIFSCKKNEENSALVVEKLKESDEITVKDLSKIRYTDYILDSRTEDIVVNWVEYNQLQDAITKVKNGDLSFFNDNNKEIKELLKNLKQNIPIEVNTASILARITAFETKLYKLESLSNLATTTKPELIAVIKEFFVAFSNLNLQMNKKLEADTIIVEKP